MKRDVTHSFADDQLRIAGHNFQRVFTVTGSKQTGMPNQSADRSFKLKPVSRFRIAIVIPFRLTLNRAAQPPIFVREKVKCRAVEFIMQSRQRDRAAFRPASTGSLLNKRLRIDPRAFGAVSDFPDHSFVNGNGGVIRHSGSFRRHKVSNGFKRSFPRGFRLQEGGERLRARLCMTFADGNFTSGNRHTRGGIFCK